jgi:two-component system response regulator (stage 0 sporulation protein F)
MRNLLSDFLTDLGHEAVATEDPFEGIAMATKGSFDICICDLHIPKKSGYEVYCEVSAVRPDLQFVVTDSLPDQLAEQARGCGVRYCLRKPFDLNQIRDVLDKILKPVKTP